MFGTLESHKQVNFGYGVKNERIGAAAIINPPHPPKKQNEKQRKKKAQKEGREGSNPLIWSPTAAVNSTLRKHH